MSEPLVQRWLAPLIVIVVACMAGCETTPQKVDAAPGILSNVSDKSRADAGEDTGELRPEESREARTLYEQKGTNRFIKDGVVGQGLTPAGAGTVRVNFLNAPLLDVVQVILGDYLKVPYTVETKIEGTITLDSRDPVDEGALLSLLESLLASHGVVMVAGEDGVYRLGAADKLRSEVQLKVGKTLPARGYDIRVVTLKYVSVNEAMKILEPLGGKDNVLHVDPVRNLLMIAAPAPEMANFLRTLEMIDVDVLAGMSFGIYEVINTDAAVVVDRFNGLVATQESNPLAGVVKLVPLEEINSVMVITPRSHYLDSVKTWIERLDKFSVGEEGDTGAHLYVYNLENGEAEQMASLLNQLFAGGMQTAMRKPATSGATAPSGQTAVVGSPEAAQAAAATARPAGGDTKAGAVRIVADDVNNTLLVMADPLEWRAIRSAVKKLDVTPAQVLVEVTIWEVQLGNNLKYGVEWFIENSFNGGNTALATLDLGGNVNPVVPGFSYLFTDAGGDWQAVINTLESQSRVEVLSSPSVLVLDNQTAEINVGNQQPVLSGTTVTEGGVTTENIQFKDTGVRLSVTPRVNEGGLVVMEIAQEVTDVGAIDEATGQRSFLQRSIKSSVAIQSGDTIVLGGLIQNNRSKGSAGIPFLSRLPVVGALFGSKSDEDNRTELLVTISPRAVNEYREFEKIGQEFREKMGAVRDSFGL